MHEHSSLRLSTKLTFAFATAIGLAMLIGLFGYFATQRVNDSLNSLYESNFNPVVELAEINIAAQSYRVDALRHIIAPDKSAMDALVAAMAADKAKVLKSIDFFRKSDMSGEEKRLLEQLDSNWKAFERLVETQVVPKSEVGQDKEATDLINSEGARYFSALEQAGTGLFDANKKQAADAYATAQAAARTGMTLTIVVLLLGGALLTFVAMAITRNVSTLLGGDPAEVVEITREIARGNLASSIRTGCGERSVLGALREMQGNLRRMIEGLSQSARALAAAADSMLELANSSSTRAGRQNDAASTIAAAVEEMTVSINHINESAREAQQLSSAVREQANHGSSVINQSTQEVQRIESSVTETATVISALEQESAGISVMVQVIKDIADQTNLLALNAAIEAARAGEQGRGFAVVADEVRKLAERTATSTKEITTMVARIQTGTHTASDSMTQGLDRVRSGVGLSAQVADAIKSINASADMSSGQVSEISSALAEQSAASSDIAKNIEVIASMSQENSVAATHVTESSTRMRELAQGLQAEVAKFKL